MNRHIKNKYSHLSEEEQNKLANTIKSLIKKSSITEGKKIHKKLSSMGKSERGDFIIGLSGYELLCFTNFMKSNNPFLREE